MSGEKLKGNIPDAPENQLVNIRRVLVIDDNVDITETFVMAMEILGHECAFANDGLAGIKIGADFKPDIIFLDIGLPGLSGYEIAKRIRKESWGKHVTLVAATGWGEAGNRQAMAEAGFDKHLSKPIDMDALEKMLRDN